MLQLVTLLYSVWPTLTLGLERGCKPDWILLPEAIMLLGTSSVPLSRLNDNSISETIDSYLETFAFINYILEVAMFGKEYKRFTGPIFVIGMPRSGTKLLRGLLKEHPLIGISPVETEFLPYWVKHWRGFGDLSQPLVFEKLYRLMLDFPYFIFMREMRKLIEPKVWYEFCKDFTPSGVFEGLIRHDVSIDYGSEKIWGDKSPSYINHLPLLKKLFPTARFIHIIRDVRDYSLSINKAWGKNMIRATQRWVDCIDKARRDASKFTENYIEVRYEDLIELPERILEKLCGFLDLEFDTRMLHLSSPAENLGDTKGKKEIIKDNKNKYFNLMEPHIRQQVESIAAPVLRSSGYDVDCPRETLKVSKGQMLAYQALDAFNLIKFGSGKRGFWDALKFNWRYFIISGNRKA